MDLRFVEEEGPIPQALLEIYVAVTLKTLYNDFDNHGLASEAEGNAAGAFACVQETSRRAVTCT